MTSDLLIITAAVVIATFVSWLIVTLAFSL
jgi:hypothetical protein